MSARRVAGNLHIVVVALQQTVSIDIERLYGAVGRDLLRESHLQALPGLAVFAPVRQLFTYNTGSRQQEWHVEVGPHSNTGEVGKLRLRPRRLERVADEGGAGSIEFLNHPARAVLDLDLLGPEQGDLPVGAERMVGRPFIAQSDRDVGLIEFSAMAFEMPERTALLQMRGEAGECLPGVEAAMGIDDLLCERID